MARRTGAPTIRRIQRDAYLISRAAGDLNAAQRGPDVLVRRLVRRRLTRTIMRGLFGH